MKTRRRFLQESAGVTAYMLMGDSPGLAEEAGGLDAYGIVDVTQKPFFADAGGKTDATKSLQGAIDYARDHRMAVFFRAGVYRITDTLNCAQKKSQTQTFPENERYNPVVLVGSRAGKARPRIYLAPKSAGYGDAGKGKYVVHYNHLGKEADGSAPASAYNDLFIGIDVEIGEGNPGAVGIYMRAAQGSSIQDSEIRVGDGLTGIEGGAGSGGGHVRVTVIGGRIGLDMRHTQPTPMITGVTLLNQRDKAIWYSGHQTLAATGLRIVSQGAGPLIHAEDGDYSAAESGKGLEGPWRGPISLVDSELVFEGKPGTAISSTSAVYLNNVYVKGASAIVRQPGQADLKGTPGGWVQVREFARGYAMPVFRGLHYSDPVYVNGAKVDQVSSTAAGVAPPRDLQSQHIWDDGFPSWEDPRAANVKKAPYGAVGDGKADDTASIQKAIDEHEIVFLPKGVYRVTRTIELRPKTKLLALCGSFSILQADAKSFSDSRHPAPILRTADDAKAETVMAFLGTWPQSPGAFHLHWRSGRRSINRSPVNDFGPTSIRIPWLRTTPSTLVTGNGGGRWYNWHEGTVNLTYTPTYRHLLVEGTREPFRVYMFDPEHPHCAAQTEFRDTRYVTLYGVKAEGNYPVMLVKDSDNFRAFGHGGNARALPESALYIFENTPNLLVAEIFDRLGLHERQSAYSSDIDPKLWSALIERLPGGKTVGAAPMERPVLYKRGNPAGEPDAK